MSLDLPFADEPDEFEETDDSQEFAVTVHRAAAESALDFLDNTREALLALVSQTRAAGYRPLWNTLKIETDVEQQEERTFASASRIDSIHTITATLTGVPRT